MFYSLGRPTVVLSFAVALVGYASTESCQVSKGDVPASIEVTRIPPGDDGSPDITMPIEGRVSGAKPGQRVVLYALSGVWWIQPFVEKPFTTIRPDSTWTSLTHPGSTYAALLVDSRFRPPQTTDVLPERGGPVLAVTTVRGAERQAPVAPIQFSGYEWEIRKNSNDPGGSKNLYSPSNAWTDRDGLLHLRVSRQEGNWVSAEVKLSRSLGYGTYRFVVRDVSHLEPAAVFAMFTWDPLGPPREMDVEISRWGEREDKNSQYVIQPYVVPANTVRFNSPSGTLTHWMDWEPGRVAFKTVSGSSPNQGLAAVSEHAFTSGVPSPGNESIHMNLYQFNNRRFPLQHEFEVIVEKFEFRP